MRCLFLAAFAAAALPCSLGCEPRPVVNEPPAGEESAVDVDATETPATPPPGSADDSADEEGGVGGQGVPVDVDATPAQQ